ncbi:MAG: class I SAM-dependent methyltransferase [Chitinophagales bacterium]
MMNENKIIKEGYDKMGSSYHERRLAKKELNYEYFDKLAPYLPSKGNLLDLGCGSGMPATQYFYDKGFNVEGVDISDTMIEIAQSSMPEASFSVGDMAEFSIKPDSYDMIMSVYAIIHVPREKQIQLLKNIHQGLKKEGVVYLVLGDQDKKVMIKEDWHGVPMYWSYFSPDKYNEIFETLNFEKIWQETSNLPNGESFYNVILRKN